MQVDTTGLPGRGGVPTGAVPALVGALRDGAPGRGRPDGGGAARRPRASRAGFRSVAALADRLGLPVRSMGMSDDLVVALEEGSTMVRVGPGLFGERPPRR